MSKGMYFCIEGIDGSGKSSIVKDLSMACHDESVVFTRMPGGTPFAEEHRGACRSADIDDVTQVLFYGALNRDASLAAKKLLDAGRDVISDRGWLSTLVYQAMPAGKEKLLLNIIDDDDLPKPDYVIYLDVDMKTSLEREGIRTSLQTEAVQDDRFSKFGLSAKEKIKEGYDLFLDLVPETNHYQTQPDDMRPTESFGVTWKLKHAIAKNYIVVDANRPYHRVLKEVMDIITNVKKANK